ncbi:hypothetical protein SAMN06265371_104333 [Lutibacter agarilyticus]|uniref:UbiA prenyltransferase family protein n=1 Tax=Lutibacter agarilyticus TaxID=1109740 RepID=A0A238X2R3_9FLAO|nr:hypothetical protein SAMN06265371_104333 [Lutibacter agarilyticus]
MQFLKKIIDFYIFSNIHVALAGFCLTKVTLLKFGFNTFISPLFVALSIIVSYNFIRFYEIKTNRLGWLKQWFIEQKKVLISLSIASILGLIYLLFFTEFKLNSLVIVLPFAFMTLFYVIPIFKIGSLEVSFRNFPGLKIFSIAIAWAGISVLFPLYQEGFKFNQSVFIEFMQRVLFLIAITLPFDIRDLPSDSEELKTIPQVLGVHNTKIIGTLLLVFFVLLGFVVQTNLITTFIIAIVTGLFLWFSTVNNSRYYASFWVEAIPIFWLCLIVLFLNN